MSPKRFDKLVAGTRLGMRMRGIPKPRSLQAAKMHLVDGVAVSQAADKVGVSAAAVYVFLARLPRERCPHCGAPMKKKDRKTLDMRQ
jgi:hypothetical protein